MEYFSEGGSPDPVAEYVYVTEPVPEGYTDIKVTEIVAADNIHAYIMETASNLEAGTFFTRIFLATLTGATDVLGKRS